jgi:hypothetical protein
LGLGLLIVCLRWGLSSWFWISSGHNMMCLICQYGPTAFFACCLTFDILYFI